MTLCCNVNEVFPHGFLPRTHALPVTKLYYLETDKKICSGDEISLKTGDPATSPLPDPRLLEMQRSLHRVGALSGAAEPR